MKDVATEQQVGTKEFLRIDLNDPTFAELARSGGRIAKLLNSAKAQSSVDLQGCLDDFLGVAYALILAKECQFTDRLSGPIEVPAVIKRAEQTAAGEVRMDGKWMAGFHFNSALFRTAAVYHRALPIVVGHRDEAAGPLKRKLSPLYRSWKNGAHWQGEEADKVRVQVNNLKHDPEGVYHYRKVQFKGALLAVGELLDLLETWVSVP